MPQRPAAPARPTASLDSARNAVALDVDDVNLREFGNKFDAIPLPDQLLAQANALFCDRSNMNYIKSNLAAPYVGLQDFYQRMANQQWQAAQPFIKRDGPAMHVARGMLAIGARRDLGAKPMLVDHSRPVYKPGHATDWNMIPGLERVNAYAFRGDKRGPRSIKAAGGFHPPNTRTDASYAKLIAERFVAYMKSRFNQDITASLVIQFIQGQGHSGRVFMEYEIWRAILKNEEMHIGRMVANEFLKGFVSTTRDARLAHYYAGAASQDGQREPTSAVYALHSEGGFLLPPQAQHVHGTKSGESEIAHPGPLPWNKVVAFRTYIHVDFNNARTFQKSKYIFVRKDIMRADPQGMQQVIWSLSALPQ